MGSAKLTVQAAVAALPTASKGIINLGAGLIAVTGEVVYVNSVTSTSIFRGQGVDVTVLNWTVDAGIGMYAMRPTTNDSSASVSFEDMTLRGPGYYQAFAYGSPPA